MVHAAAGTLALSGLVPLLAALLGGRRALNGYKVLLGHDAVRSAFAGALAGRGLGVHTAHRALRTLDSNFHINGKCEGKEDLKTE